MRRRLATPRVLASLAVASVLGLAGCGGVDERSGGGSLDSTGQVTSVGSTSDTGSVSSTVESPPPEFRPSSALRPSELATFQDFAIYWLGSGFEDLPLVEILREKESHLVIPNDPASRVEVDSVFLIYGTCDPGAGDSCAAPLGIDISPACRVNPTTYDGPADIHPLKRTVVRGVPADDFGDSVILYSGDVAIKIFAEPDLALRAAAALAPSNALGQKAMVRATAPGDLPPPDSGALDGTIACQTSRPG